MRIEPNRMVERADGTVVVPIGPPETRPATPIAADSRTRGERVVWCDRAGWHFDLRATSDPHARAKDGQLAVHVVHEIDWYAFVLQGTPLVPVEILARTLFLERPAPTT